MPPLVRCHKPPKSTQTNTHTFKIGATLEGATEGWDTLEKLQAEKIKTLKKEIVVVVLERNKLKQKNG